MKLLIFSIARVGLTLYMFLDCYFSMCIFFWHPVYCCYNAEIFFGTNKI
jgi:hypothetical protein